MTKKPPSLGSRLNEAFPLVVRYVGLVLAVALVIATIVTGSFVFSSGFVLAAGMIGYKTVRDASESGGKGNGSSEGP